MGVRASVEADLRAAGIEDWRRDVLLSLADVLDGDSPNASAAKELWARMEELGAKPVEKAGDVSDDLAAKRAARRKAAG